MEKLGIARNLYKQFMVGRYCDLHIEVENTTFRAHRCVVAAASWVLEAILHSSTQDTGATTVAIQLHGVTSFAINSLLSYIYTGKLDPELFVDNAKQKEVLHAAKLYKLDDITAQLQSGNTGPCSSTPDDVPSITEIRNSNEDVNNNSDQSSNQVSNYVPKVGTTAEDIGDPKARQLSLDEKKKYVSKSCKFSKDNELLYCILCCEMFSETADLLTHMNNHKPGPAKEPRPERAAAVAAIAATSLALDDSIDDMKDGEFSVAMTPKKRRKMISRKVHKCAECDSFSHTDKMELVNHYKLQHPDVSFCEACGDRFPSVEQLQTHSATHEEVKQDLPESKSPKPTRRKSSVRTPRKVFSCNLCGSNFSRKRDLVQHQKTLHGIFKPMHVCTVCGREFKEKAGLRSHTRVHTGEKPYMCTYCGNSFADQKTWKDHERRHRGEKPFLCTTCGKSFTYRQSFTRHMKFHEGKRPFQCSFCGKAFVLRQNLREHEKRHNK